MSTPTIRPIENHPCMHPEKVDAETGAVAIYCGVGWSGLEVLWPDGHTTRLAYCNLHGGLGKARAVADELVTHADSLRAAPGSPQRDA